MTACALCRTEGEVLIELPASITSESKALTCPSRLMLCPRCGHLFTHADVDWHTYYSAQYDATLTDDGLDELVVLPDGATQFRTDFDYGLFRRMLGASLSPSSTRLLELGCGRGRILSRLSRDGFEHVWACDVSERYRAHAAELIGAERVFIGELPRGPFDTVATFFMLEHDVDPLGSLAAVRERLTDDGSAFIMVPDWRTNVGDLACADHAHHFSIETLRLALAAVGLVVTGVDVSVAGSLAVTAKRGEVAARFDDPDRVASNREAVQPLIATLARLRELPDRFQRRRVFLYGAGFYAALAAAFVPEVAGIFDANPRKQGLTRFGHTVAPPRAIENGRHADDCLVICVNARSAGAIAEQYRAAFSEIVTL